MVMKKHLVFVFGICQFGTSHLIRSQTITRTRKRNQEKKYILLLISQSITRFLYQFGKTTKFNSYLFFFPCAFLLESSTYSTSTTNWRFILLNLKQKKALKTQMFPYRERKPRPYPWIETIHLSCTFTVLQSASHLGICQ